MEHIIEEKTGFKIVGIAVNTNINNAPNEVPEVWEKFMKRQEEISCATEEMKQYGVCFDIDKEKGEFRYIACKAVSEFENLPEEMVMADVEASKYAVFTHKGKLDGLGKTYSEIMHFIQEKVMRQKPFWVEFYDDRFKGDVEESELEIWIAIE